jgi:nucleotide-binding universal stress UspA family protein
LDCLVYVDSSTRGDWALALAALLPGREQRSFHLLATSEDLEAHPDLLERAATRLSGARSIRTLTRPGPPRNAVVLEARERPYDLVVVPPAGRNAVQRLFKGSRVATVVRSVRVPVLVARHPPARLDRILAAVSGGEPTGAVVAAAAELAGGRGHVDYLHVASEVALPFRPHDAPAPATSAPAVPDALHSAQEALARAGGTGSLVVREGIVVDEVLDAFESGHYDLLVVGASTEEDRGLGREDLAQRIVLRCSGSTLVVPASRLRPGAGAGHDRA